MEKTATLNLRVNPHDKRNAEEILSLLGIPMSTAVGMFLKQISLTGGIPFNMTLPQAPNRINTSLMTDDELRMKILRGYESAEAGRVNDARDVFKKFKERVNDGAV